MRARCTCICEAPGDSSVDYKLPRDRHTFPGTRDTFPSHLARLRKPVDPRPRPEPRVELFQG